MQLRRCDPGPRASGAGGPRGKWNTTCPLQQKGRAQGQIEPGSRSRRIAESEEAYYGLPSEKARAEARTDRKVEPAGTGPCTLLIFALLMERRMCTGCSAKYESVSNDRNRERLHLLGKTQDKLLKFPCRLKDDLAESSDFHRPKAHGLRFIPSRSYTGTMDNRQVRRVTSGDGDCVECVNAHLRPSVFGGLE